MFNNCHPVIKGKRTVTFNQLATELLAKIANNQRLIWVTPCMALWFHRNFKLPSIRKLRCGPYAARLVARCGWFSFVFDI